MELVGKTLKSQLNGNLFTVTELFTEDNKEFYAVLDMSSGKHFAIGRELFEKFVMPNVKMVEVNI